MEHQKNVKSWYQKYLAISAVCEQIVEANRKRFALLAVRSGESTSDLHNGPVIHKAFPGYDIIMCTAEI